jgi:hypothetical protein
MKQHSVDTSSGAATASVTNKLAGMAPIGLDYDEARSREERGYGETVFTRRFSSLPRWLVGRKHRDT